jgi:hypothetical protein
MRDRANVSSALKAQHKGVVHAAELHDDAAMSAQMSWRLSIIILAGRLTPWSCLVALEMLVEKPLQCRCWCMLALEAVVGQPWTKAPPLICCLRCPQSAHQRADRGQDESAGGHPHATPDIHASLQRRPHVSLPATQATGTLDRQRCCQSALNVSFYAIGCNLPPHISDPS